MLSSPPNNNRRVLFAEDDAGIQQTLRLILRGAGFDFDIASDGDEAAELYQAAVTAGRPYDLLVLDGAMPFKTGFAVAELVRASGDLEVPIIFLSADESAMSVGRGSMSHPLAYWVKPAALMGIRARIEQTLESL